MDNMQILHECRDGRDNHFSNQRTGIRNCANQLPNGESLQCTTEDDFDTTDDSESLILDHLLSMQSTNPVVNGQTPQDILSCLHHAEVGGLFSPEHSLNIEEAMISHSEHEEVFERQPALEDIWKKTYEDCRQAWKRKAQTHSTSQDSNNFTK